MASSAVGADGRPDPAKIFELCDEGQKGFLSVADVAVNVARYLCELLNIPRIQFSERTAAFLVGAFGDQEGVVHVAQLPTLLEKCFGFLQRFHKLNSGMPLAVEHLQTMFSEIGCAMTLAQAREIGQQVCLLHLQSVRNRISPTHLLKATRTAGTHPHIYSQLPIFLIKITVRRERQRSFGGKRVHAIAGGVGGVF